MFTKQNVCLILIVLSFNFLYSQDKIASKKQVEEVIQLLRESLKAADNKQFKKSDSIFELAILKSNSPKNEICEGYCYNHRGMLNAKLGNYNEAIELHDKAIEIAKKHKELKYVFLPTTYAYKANALIYKKEYKKAKETLQKAIEINQLFKASNSRVNYLYNNFNMGNIHLNLNELDAAIENFNIVLKDSIQIKSIFIPSYSCLGKIYEKKGDINRAIKYINSIVEITSNNPAQLQENYERNKVLKRLFLKNNDYKNALQISELMLEMKDSIQAYITGSDLSLFKENYSANFYKEKAQNLKNINHKNKIILWTELFLILSFMLFLFILYEKNKILKDLKFQAESNYLKSQIKPHFFFNLLNSICTLSVSNPLKVSESVLKLSDLMEYVGFTQEDKHTLKEEVDFIENYIDFENTTQNVTLNYKIDYSTSLIQAKVYPLLFNPIIENIFKHGNFLDPLFHLQIRFEKIKETLLCTFINTIEPDKHNHNIVEEDLQIPLGVGLENLKKRLKFHYGDNSQLKAVVKDNFYIVQLNIPYQV